MTVGPHRCFRTTQHSASAPAVAASSSEASPSSATVPPAKPATTASDACFGWEGREQAEGRGHAPARADSGRRAKERIRGLPRQQATPVSEPTCAGRSVIGAMSAGAASPSTAPRSAATSHQSPVPALGPAAPAQPPTADALAALRLRLLLGGCRCGGRGALRQPGPHPARAARQQ